MDPVLQRRMQQQAAKATSGSNGESDALRQGACSNFQRDLSGAFFDVCKCGKRMSEHVPNTEPKTMSKTKHTSRLPLATEPESREQETDRPSTKVFSPPSVGVQKMKARRHIESCENSLDDLAHAMSTYVDLFADFEFEPFLQKLLSLARLAATEELESCSNDRELLTEALQRRSVEKRFGKAVLATDDLTRFRAQQRKLDRAFAVDELEACYDDREKLRATIKKHEGLFSHSPTPGGLERMPTRFSARLKALDCAHALKQLDESLDDLSSLTVCLASASGLVEATRLVPYEQQVHRLAATDQLEEALRLSEGLDFKQQIQCLKVTGELELENGCASHAPAETMNKLRTALVSAKLAVELTDHETDGTAAARARLAEAFSRGQHRKRELLAASVSHKLTGLLDADLVNCSEVVLGMAMVYKSLDAELAMVQEYELHGLIDEELVARAHMRRDVFTRNEARAKLAAVELQCDARDSLIDSRYVKSLSVALSSAHAAGLKDAEYAGSVGNLQDSLLQMINAATSASLATAQSAMKSVCCISALLEKGFIPRAEARLLERRQCLARALLQTCTATLTEHVCTAPGAGSLAEEIKVKLRSAIDGTSDLLPSDDAALISAREALQTVYVLLSEQADAREKLRITAALDADDDEDDANGPTQESIAEALAAAERILPEDDVVVRRTKDRLRAVAEREKLAELRRHFEQLTGDTFDVPTEFLCPITQEKMRRPVVAADGISYERAAIERWLHEHSRSPTFNTELKHKHLVDNINLRKRIEEYETERFQAFETIKACASLRRQSSSQSTVSPNAPVSLRRQPSVSGSEPVIVRRQRSEPATATKPIVQVPSVMVEKADKVDSEARSDVVAAREEQPQGLRADADADAAATASRIQLLEDDLARARAFAQELQLSHEPLDSKVLVSPRSHSSRGWLVIVIVISLALLAAGWYVMQLHSDLAIIQEELRATEAVATQCSMNLSEHLAKASAAPAYCTSEVDGTVPAMV